MAALFGVASYLSFAVNTLILLALHTRAQGDDVEDSLWDRIQQGPEATNGADKILFACVILLSFELLDFSSKHSGQWFGSQLIPVRGKHLDDLNSRDLFFIALSKAGTAPFVYFYLSFAFHEPNVAWNLSEINATNTLAALVAIFVVYDFFYTLLHWFLHIKAVYGYIHKHHHHQKAPSRANVDAVNVHPIEFVLGEYNHLLALFLCTRVMQLHVLTSLAFLGIGGFLAGINHTRYDISLTIFGVEVFDSKAHDVHHRIPQSNYGQYIMLWDRIFGTYRSYNPKDRVNPDAQLDPVTGKSFSYGKTKAQ